MHFYSGNQKITVLHVPLRELLWLLPVTFASGVL